MNTNKNPNLVGRYASRSLTPNQMFEYDGMVYRFLNWKGYATSNRYGSYRTAAVLNLSIGGQFRTISLNQAGSVRAVTGDEAEALDRAFWA